MMNPQPKVDKLQNDFADRVCRHKNMLLYRPEDALDFVTEIRERGLILDDVLAFRLWPEGIQPFMEHDFSFVVDRFNDATYIAGAIEHIKGYLQSDYMFEIWASDEPITDTWTGTPQ